MEDAVTGVSAGVTHQRTLRINILTVLLTLYVG